MVARSLPATPHWTLIRDAVALALLAYWWIWLVQSASALPAMTDARAYWSSELGPDLYGRLGEESAFLYSPLVAQLIAPLTALPFVAFYALLSAASLAALVWLVGPVFALAALFVFPPVSHEIGNGNIHLLLAAAIAAAVSRPGWWSVPLLTKVTPGVGLLWHVFRREWRAVFVALGATTALVAVSALIAPDLWLAWIDTLRESDPAYASQYAVFGGWPVGLRVGVAALLVGVAAWRERPALLAVACLLALPAVWTNAYVMLLAIPRFTRIR